MSEVTIESADRGSVRCEWCEWCATAPFAVVDSSSSEYTIESLLFALKAPPVRKVL